MKKIIVPVDFSVHSEYALEVAANIARQHRAHLYLLHMLDISEQLISETEATERREINYFSEITKKRFEKFIDKDFMQGIDATPIIKKFKVFREVNNCAKELDADLIIMGSKGAEGLKGFFVGSNTSKVVQTSQVPVLVIKKREENFSPRLIVFASNFAPENLPAFKNAKAFSTLFKADIKLVYINTPNVNFNSTQEIRERMRLFLSKNSLPINTSEILVYNDYTIEGGILNAAKDLKADMIAIPTHGRKGINKLLTGNVSGDVANHSNKPVLTLKV